MLSFIRKRLPSKDRTNEHLQNVKSNHLQHQHQDNSDGNNNGMRKSQSINELNDDNNNNNNNQNKKKNKNKKKGKSASISDEVILNSSPTIERINKSYSDVDYLPMMPGALSQSIKHDKTDKNHDSLLDSYFNPLDIVQTTNHLNYVETTPTQARIVQIPVVDCRKQQKPNYNDLDHQRTKALRDITEQRIQQRSVK